MSDIEKAAAMYARENATLRARVAELEDVQSGFRSAALLPKDMSAQAVLNHLLMVAQSHIANEDRLKARVLRLRTALEQHGAHDPSCGVLCLLATNPPMRQPCTCGLSRALEVDHD